MDKLDIFVNRLKKIGIKIELLGNVPWIYLDKVNGNEVKDKHASDWGFVLGYRNRKFVFEDLDKIFKVIRKYR